MIYNTTVLQSTTKADRQWLVKVIDICLMVQEYINTLKQEFPTFECHTICRAIAEHIQELRVEDGHYVGIYIRRRKDKPMTRLQFCTHSWLVTPSGSIIDPYPVGYLSANPILVVNRGKYKSFGGNLYWRDEKVTEIIDTKELRERVRVLSQIINEALIFSK